MAQFYDAMTKYRSFFLGGATTLSLNLRRHEMPTSIQPNSSRKVITSIHLIGCGSRIYANTDIAKNSLGLQRSLDLSQFKM